MKRRSLLLLLILLSSACLGFGPPVFTDSDVATRTLTPQQFGAMGETAVPEITAGSAILVSYTSREVLYRKAEHEQRAPASLTKIASAIVALERGNLEESYSVWPIDLGVGSLGGLRNGEHLTVWELVQIALIPSDNAATACLARNMGASQGVFVGWMNDLVEGLGLQDTHFVNSHGLDADGHYSTAYDVALLSIYAMQNPRFADVVKDPERIVAEHWLVNSNDLLTSYPGAIGIKTGTTDNAGECLSALVQRPQGSALVVVMGSENRFTDAALLLDYYYANYAEFTVDLPADDLNRYQDDEGYWHRITIAEPVTLLVQPWQMGSATVYRRIDTTLSQVSPGEVVGALEISVAGKLVHEEPLYVQ